MVKSHFQVARATTRRVASDAFLMNSRVASCFPGACCMHLKVVESALRIVQAGNVFVWYRHCVAYETRKSTATSAQECLDSCIGTRQALVLLACLSRSGMHSSLHGKCFNEDGMFASTAQCERRDMAIITLVTEASMLTRHMGSL